MCGYHNRELLHTLVDHLFAKRLKSIEYSLLVDRTKSKVKLANISLLSKKIMSVM